MINDRSLLFLPITRRLAAFPRFEAESLRSLSVLLALLELATLQQNRGVQGAKLVYMNKHLRAAR